MKALFITGAFILALSLAATASDFSLYRNDIGHWIIEFIDEEHPHNSHIINIIVNGRVWKKEISAVNNSKFDTKINTDERPSVDIEEYE